MAKRAFITGIAGQDGSYLTELLLEKGYQVFGMRRRSSTSNTHRLDHIDDPNLTVLYGDLSDGSSIVRILHTIRPDEIYNLAAQSHVGISFEKSEYTADVNALGALRILETIRALNLPARYYQASSSEMFGKALQSPQNEQTPLNPQSPYGLSKMFAFYTAKIFRTGYGIFASNGILFNHESPRRGFNFVTRKITLGLARVKFGLQEKVQLGNLDARRDWGHSQDSVEAMWRILQHSEPDDFVIATGETHTVREFAEEAARCMDMEIEWAGSGLDERGIDRKTGKTVIDIDPRYLRPNEIEFLRGDAAKARRVLGWESKIPFKDLVRLMAEHDLDYVKREAALGRLTGLQKDF